jgi:competence protein ComEA
MDLNLTKEQQLIIIGLIASLLVGLGVMAFKQIYLKPDQGIAIEEPKSMHDPLPNTDIMVHISGAVRREGVYKLKSADRKLDAVRLAGGALATADLSAMNLAEPAKDGEKIIVPVKPAVIEKGSVSNRYDSGSGKQGSGIAGATFSKVNINSADEKTLDSLPGIGPSTARAIVEYRSANGPFSRIEQIMEMPRFGKSKFEKIKNKITV